MLRCPVLVQRWFTIFGCWPSVAPTIVLKTTILRYYATCTLTHLQTITDHPCSAIGPQRRANDISSHYQQDVGPTLGRGTRMIASSSTFRPHPGRVIRDLFRLLNAVYGIVWKH